VVQAENDPTTKKIHNLFLLSSSAQSFKTLLFFPFVNRFKLLLQYYYYYYYYYNHNYNYFQ